MADAYWLALPLPLVVGMALSFALESLLQPRPVNFWKRPPATLAIHAGIWVVLFLAELALFRRPWFAAGNVLALLLAVVLVSNAKSHALREPFVFQDFEYFTDALKHPRLYIPFLGLWRGVGAVAGIVAALTAGLSLEAPLTEALAVNDFIGALLSTAILAAGMVVLAHRRLPAMRHDPASDLKRFGLFAYLCAYAIDERRPLEPSTDRSPFFAAGDEAGRELPDLLVIQSESFFDARRLFDGIRPEVLAEFDALKAASVAHGLLAVPAWGANTVRTEFAFLAGLDPATLGVHRFNPYRKLARQGVPTLASFLRSMGYRTICVHPYPDSFYARDTVYPLLGFDQFIDIRGFAGSARSGPYIGDLALADKVISLLSRESSQPIFVFVITMENHGPLHLEKVQPGDVESLYSSPPPSGCDDLTIYLRHLLNADRMAGVLRDRLKPLPCAAWLCWFGDHVPIMPKVYEAMGEPQGRTDYLIWTNTGDEHDRRCQDSVDLKVEDLGTLLLQKMELIKAAPAAGKP